MLQKYYRPANDLDFIALTRSRGSLRHNIIMVCIPIALLAFAGVYVVWRSILAASAVATVLLVASISSNVRFFRKVKRRKDSKTDSQAVEVLDVSSVRVLDIQALGDNAPAFCFFVDEGKGLLLIGQWLLEYDSFPSNSFRIHRWSDTKQPIRIEVTGQHIDAEPSSVRLKTGYRFGKLELIDAMPETLQDDLDRSLIRKSGVRDSGPSK